MIYSMIVLQSELTFTWSTKCMYFFLIYKVCFLTLIYRVHITTTVSQNAYIYAWYKDECYYIWLTECMYLHLINLCLWVLQLHMFYGLFIFTPDLQSELIFSPDVQSVCINTWFTMCFS